MWDLWCKKCSNFSPNTRFLCQFSFRQHFCICTIGPIIEAIQGVPGMKVIVLERHANGYSKHKSVYVHAFHSNRFPR
jgi:hypothetical protein